MNAVNSPTAAPVLLRVGEFARLANISRSKAYDLIKAGAIPTVELGSSLRIPASVLDSLVREALESHERRAGADAR
jgi:excisionase family DNA binding protein